MKIRLEQREIKEVEEMEELRQRIARTYKEEDLQELRKKLVHLLYKTAYQLDEFRDIRCLRLYAERWLPLSREMLTGLYEWELATIQMSVNEMLEYWDELKQKRLAEKKPGRRKQIGAQNGYFLAVMKSLDELRGRVSEEIWNKVYQRIQEAREKIQKEAMELRGLEDCPSWMAVNTGCPYSGNYQCSPEGPCKLQTGGRTGHLSFLAGRDGSP
jgi:hypothetical protein